jgi:hypothetical protein
MSDGAAENGRMRLDVHLHLAGEDRAYLAGLLLGVESRRGSVAQFPASDHGVAAAARPRGGGTFIKAFCVAALVAVVAGESYRTDTSGRVKSLQSLIFFGFPLRTKKATVEVYGDEL